jgi:hypothetical protein
VLLDLAPLRPHADAGRIFVEAYHQTTRMRFDFGTVAAPVFPPPLDRRLHDFDDWRFVRFRVKVTDVTDSPGRIIAWADRIRPKGPDDQDQSDLVRFKDEDLYGRLWDLDFDDEGPIVLIDRATGGSQKIGRDDRFIAAAYPEILRRVLHKALIEDQATHDDSTHWFNEWYEGFLKAKLRLAEPGTDNDPASLRAWIDNAVEVFSRHFQIAGHWADAQEKD